MKTQKTRFKIKRSLWDQLKPDTITEEEEEILEGVNEKFEQKNPMIDNAVENLYIKVLKWKPSSSVEYKLWKILLDSTLIEIQRRIQFR